MQYVLQKRMVAKAKMVAELLLVNLRHWHLKGSQDLDSQGQVV